MLNESACRRAGWQLVQLLLNLRIQIPEPLASLGFILHLDTAPRLYRTLTNLKVVIK